MYYKVAGGDQEILLLLYMDDLFLTGDEKLILDTKKKLTAKFKMKELGTMHYLGREVWQKPAEIVLSLGKHVVEILKRFGMMDCKSITTPMTTN